MAVDFNLPTVDTTYTAFPTQIIENIDAALQQLSVGSPSNVPTGAIKFDLSANRWKKYNGSAYVDLTGTYDLNAAVNVNQLNLGDDEAVRLGDSQDFQLFHRASDNLSIISESGSGYLSLQSNGSRVEMYDSANNRTMAEFNTGGACTFKHGATTRLETTSSGATVTGDLTTTGSANIGVNAILDGSAGGGRQVSIGDGRTADGNSFIDLVGDDTNTTYGGRLIRNGGANSKTELLHRGTQSLDINAVDAGQVTLRTSNLARLRILSGGDVGIGLTNPSNKLHIYSGSSNALSVQTTVNGANILLLDNDTESKFRAVDGRLLIEADTQNNIAGSEIRLQIDGSEKWTLEADGDVQQTGNLTISNIQPFIQFDDTNNESDFQIGNAGGRFRIRDTDNAADRFSITTAGSVLINNTNEALANNDADDLIVGDTSGARGITIVSSTSDTGNLFFSDGTGSPHQGAVVYGHGDNHIAFMTNGYNERFRVTAEGRLGLGVTNPQAALHIAGSGALGSIRLIDSSTSSGAPNLEIIGKRSDSNNNTAFAANIFLGKNRTDAKVVTNNILGNVNFGGNHTNGNESNISYTACIRAQASGNFDSKSDMPTDLVFCTGTAGKDRDGETAGQSNVGTERLRIDSTGDLHISKRMVIANNSAAYPAYSFTNSNNMGFYRHTSNQIGVSIGGAGRFRFTNNQFGPLIHDDLDLGSSNFKFDNIFATSGTVSSSDQNFKNTIATSDLGLDFINRLNPVSYKFNGKTRTHYGLIAQEIETVLGAISKPATDFGGFCKDEKDDDGVDLETPLYGLRYIEFIAPIIKAIQELSAKVAALEAA